MKARMDKRMQFKNKTVSGKQKFNSIICLYEKLNKKCLNYLNNYQQNS